MRTALLLLFSIVALGDSSADVLNLFSAAAEALTNDDSTAFLDKFDRNMPEYAALRRNIEGLLAGYEVGSTIEVVRDEGDDEKRMVELDWLLVTAEKNAVNGDQQTRRQIVKCTLARQGKQWRIIAVAPVDFFKK